MALASYSPLGLAHISATVISFASGGWIFYTRKGTALHERIGWVYVISMAIVGVSALTIRNLTGRFNLFHALALLILMMVGVGLYQVIAKRRPRRWLWRHYQYMSWSYVSLLAGAANEACVRIGALRTLTQRAHGWPPVVASAVIVGVSAVVIIGRQKATLKSTGFDNSI